MKYYKKSIVVEANQFTGENYCELLNWINEGNLKTLAVRDGCKLMISTTEGWCLVNPNDYIIKEVSGDFYTCKPDFFQITYNRIDQQISSNIDTNVEAVRQKLLRRSIFGISKYGVTTDRTDTSTIEWLNHFQEELMDACVYIERILTDFDKATNKVK